MYTITLIQGAYDYENTKNIRNDENYEHTIYEHIKNDKNDISTEEFDRIDVRLSSLQTSRFTYTQLFDLATLHKCSDLNNDAILTKINSI